MDLTTILIILGVAAVGVGAYFLFFKNNNSTPSQAAEFNVKFSQLSTNAQAGITDLITNYSNPSVNYNGQQGSFTIAQLTSGTDPIGLSLINGDASVKIYFTYYEFINLAASGPTGILTIPARTVENGIVTNSTTSGYTITTNMGNFTITPVQQAVTRGLVAGGNSVPLTSSAI